MSYAVDPFKEDSHSAPSAADPFADSSVRNALSGSASYEPEYVEHDDYEEDSLHPKRTADGASFVGTHDDYVMERDGSGSGSGGSAAYADLERRERELQHREADLEARAAHIRKHGRNNFPPCTSPLGFPAFEATPLTTARPVWSENSLPFDLPRHFGGDPGRISAGGSASVLALASMAPRLVAQHGRLHHPFRLGIQEHGAQRYDLVYHLPPYLVGLGIFALVSTSLQWVHERTQHLLLRLLCLHGLPPGLLCVHVLGNPLDWVRRPHNGHRICCRRPHCRHRFCCPYDGRGWGPGGR